MATLDLTGIEVRVVSVPGDIDLEAEHLLGELVVGQRIGQLRADVVRAPGQVDIPGSEAEDHMKYVVGHFFDGTGAILGRLQGTIEPGARRSGRRWL